MEAWWLDLKFSAAQLPNPIPIPNIKYCKINENLSFLNRNGWVLQNHRLGIHSNKIWADSTTQNTLEYLTTCLADLSNRPKYLGYLKTSSHWVSIVRLISKWFQRTIWKRYKSIKKEAVNNNVVFILVNIKLQFLASLAKAHSFLQQCWPRSSFEQSKVLQPMSAKDGFVKVPWGLFNDYVDTMRQMLVGQIVHNCTL